jgi:hypothetical protein
MPIQTLTAESPAPASENGQQSELDSAHILQQVTEALNADLFLFSGPLERKQANLFLDVAEKVTRRENVALVLCTYGGDADAAFIVARYLKRFYKHFTLFVFGFCKSAGTLIALGADAIVMSHRSELGPLDVQLLKADELIFRSSGLDVQEALTSLSEQAFSDFQKHFVELIRRGGGAITTKTAAEIASTLSVGLFAPITGQIDPLKLGEAQRALNISSQYGRRLNQDANRVKRLVSAYPSHTFVIDYEEAKTVFGNVREPSDVELEMERVLQAFEEELEHECVRTPEKDGIVVFLNPAEEGATANVSSEANQTTSVPTAGETGEHNRIDHGGDDNNRRADREGIPVRQSADEQPASGERAEGVSA